MMIDWYPAFEKTHRELEQLQAFKDRIDAAHKEHLQTGDYARLGMATQDALLAFEGGQT